MSVDALCYLIRACQVIKTYNAATVRVLIVIAEDADLRHYTRELMSIAGHKPKFGRAPAGALEEVLQASLEERAKGSALLGRLFGLAVGGARP